MRRLARSLSIVCFAAALVASPSVAIAAPSAADRAQAVELKKKGDAEMDALHYAEALAAYTEAYTLTSDPALLYNRARVLEALLRYAEAVDELNKFAADAPPALKARVPKLQELIDELNGKLTKLTVRCPVPNARVLVRDRAIGKTPLEGARVNSGTAQIEVVAEGYVPFRKSIELPGGGELVIDAPLAMRDARGRLVVSSTPAGADVSVDGRSLGVAPAEAELSPGNHKVVVSLSGYRDTAATAVVVEGQRKTLDVTLDKKPPITSTWWFWTGVGAVVVGATTATLVYALGTERSAGTGDIAPGQVAGPLRF